MKNQQSTRSVSRISDVGYPNVLISLLFDQEHPKVIRAVRARGDEWEAIKSITVRRFPGPDLLSQVLESGVARYIADSRSDPSNDKKAIQESGIISQYVVPLSVGDKQIGTMQINFGECPRKPEFQCKVLDALGKHLSIAISRFRALVELRNADARLMEFGKLALGNEVASAMMHQLRPEISAFQIEISQLLNDRKKSEHPVVRSVLTKLKKHIDHWKTRIETPLEFMIGKEDPKGCIANDIIRSTMDYWRADAEARKCKLKFREHEQSVMLEIRPSQLHELLSCLLVNALQAHAHIIDVTLGLGFEFCGSGQREKAAIITIEDDGIGISENIVNDIFSLGFTTKRQKGTGLGLFIVKRLATAMSGEISLISEGRASGRKNTAFRLVIPAYNK